MQYKEKRIKRIGAGLALICIFCAGCGVDNKEKCDINVSDTITITYADKEYVMLSETVSQEEIGAWVGYVSENISGAMFSTVYLDKKNENMIDVAVDDSFYRAVRAEVREEEQALMQPEDKKIFDNIFDIEEGIFPKELTVNPDNATQLIGEDKVYQVTDQSISKEDLQGYITGISEYVVFDTDTKKVLERKEYTQIDWDGRESDGKERTVWVYMDVYRIKESDMDSIGVKINGTYYIAIALDES